MIEFIEKYFHNLELNLNDTLAYACSDCEELLSGELSGIHELYKKYGEDGVNAWVVVLREKGEKFRPIQVLDEEKYKKAYKECYDNKEKYYDVRQRKLIKKFEEG